MFLQCVRLQLLRSSSICPKAAWEKPWKGWRGWRDGGDGGDGEDGGSALTVRDGSGEAPGITFPAGGSCASLRTARETFDQMSCWRLWKAGFASPSSSKEKKIVKCSAEKNPLICNTSFFFFNFKQ